MKLDPPLAVLTIPRLGIQVPAFNGTDDLTLNRGAGRASEAQRCRAAVGCRSRTIRYHIALGGTSPGMDSGSAGSLSGGGIRGVLRFDAPSGPS